MIHGAQQRRQAFPFGVALHTYYDVGHLDATSISGLQHQQYTDHHLHAHAGIPGAALHREARPPVPVRPR
jgi:D-hexose-6-phosphate mutarotase